MRSGSGRVSKCSLAGLRQRVELVVGRVDQRSLAFGAEGRHRKHLAHRMDGQQRAALARPAVQRQPPALVDQRDAGRPFQVLARRAHQPFEQRVLAVMRDPADAPSPRQASPARPPVRRFEKASCIHLFLEEKERPRLEKHRGRDGRHRSGIPVHPTPAGSKGVTPIRASSSGLSRGSTAVDDCRSCKGLGEEGSRPMGAGRQILGTSPRMTTVP